VGQLKPILRRAESADLLSAERFRRKEAEVVERCKEEVARFDLSMKIIGAEHNYDGTRLTIFFAAEQRVDFRELVRELAHIFRTRIELRQIGVRDQAKLIGGLGKCGRALCCATWLTEFCPVSIRMAKQQGLPLSPMEISGLCGRLLCCLGYENEYYREIKSHFPKVGKMIDTPYGHCKVVKVNVLSETVTILLEDGSTVELTAEQLSQGPASVAKSEPHGLTEAQRQALDAAVGTLTSEPNEPSETNSQGASNQPPPKGAPRRSRSHRRPRSKASSRRKARGSGTSGQHPATQAAQSEEVAAKRARRPRRRAKRRSNNARQRDE
jgi:cell fate regulator YaaT (PSP1 superfamily)